MTPLRMNRNPDRLLLNVPVRWVFVLCYLLGAALEIVAPFEFRKQLPREGRSCSARPSGPARDRPSSERISCSSSPIRRRNSGAILFLGRLSDPTTDSVTEIVSQIH